MVGAYLNRNCYHETANIIFHGLTKHLEALLPLVQAGKVKFIAVTSAHRVEGMKELASVAESGYPGFEASVWYGLVAPAATPKAIVSKLHAEVQKALQTPEVRQRMNAVGGEVVPGSAEMFTNLIRSERVRYDKLVREANIQPE